MIAWLLSIAAGVDWWLWIALAACVAIVVGLWLFPRLSADTRIIGSAAIVAAMTIGLLLHALQAQSARADEAETMAAAEKQLRDSAERQLREAQQSAMERAADEDAIAALGKDMTNAIDKAAARAPGAAPGPASVALGCIRLRAAGATASEQYQRLCA